MLMIDIVNVGLCIGGSQKYNWKIESTEVYSYDPFLFFFSCYFIIFSCAF